MPATILTLFPTEYESRLAREFNLHFKDLAPEENGPALHIHAADNPGCEFPLPLSVIRVILGALKEMGEGNGLLLTSIRKELTTQQAADFLSVSRPFLIAELLEKGKVRYRKVGNRRKISYSDLLRYQQEEELESAKREEVMRELMAETEKLGLY